MKQLIFCFLLAVFVTVAFLHAVEAGVYAEVFASVDTNEHGVKDITYEQFMNIRNSGQPYLLLDVLSEKSYARGHIPGAENFPRHTISAASAAERLSPASAIIVYCGSFKCSASTAAAQNLQKLGYTVVDYKGGIKEWLSKGNELIQK